MFFNPKAEFEILNFDKDSNYPSSETDTTICGNWELTKTEIKTIIQDSKFINGIDWHHLFEHLPCQVIGVISQHGQKFNMAINGGAWLTISSADTTLIMGDFKVGNNQYFLSSIELKED